MNEHLPDAMKAIMRLNRTEPTEANYQKLKDEFSLLVESTVSTVKMTGNELFFRVRKNPASKPVNLAHLGVPPADKTVGYQRCNGPNEPMFYTGSRRITALLESRVEPGDIIYLSQWIGDSKGVGINVSLDMNTALPTNSSWLARSQVVLSYFDTIFTRRIHRTYSDDYRFTAAATQALTKGFQVSDDAGAVISENVALRYASVVDVARSYNTAFHPEQVQKLITMHVAELRIDEVKERDISATLLDTAIRFGTDGEIRWTGDLTLIPSLRRMDRAVPYRSAGDGKWDVDTVDRVLTKSEFHEFLNE